MSLVNDMLNDLDERRRDKPSADVNLEWMSGEPAARPSRRVLPFFSAAFIAVLLVISWALWKTQIRLPEQSADSLLNRQSAVSTVQSEEPIEPAGLERDSLAIERLPVRSDSAPNSQRANVDKRNIETVLSANLDNERVTTAEPVKVLKEMPPSPTVEEKIDSSELRNRSASVPSGKNVTDPITVVSDKKADSVSTRDSGVVAIVTKPTSPKQLDIQSARVARENVRVGRVAVAQKRLQEFLQENPLARRSATVLASIWMGEKRYNEAGQLLEKLMLNSPRDTGLLMLRARVFLATERAGSAVEILLSRQPFLSDNVAYYELLALSARENNQYQMSEKLYQNLLAVDNKRGEWWLGLGVALDAQALSSRARSAFANALTVGVDDTILENYARQRLARK